MKRETPFITGVTTGNNVRPRISLRLAICWRRSRNRAPMSWFMASAICSVTAVPVVLYGTGVRLTLAMNLNSSPARWPLPPGAVMT